MNYQEDVPAVRNSRIDATWSHLRTRQTPLYQMPHMWQPNLHMSNPYHRSHCDIRHKTWEKNAMVDSAYYGSKSHQENPDWYVRRTSDISNGHTNARLWHYENCNRPTEHNLYGDKLHTPQPQRQGVGNGVLSRPARNIEGQLANPKWGIYNPSRHDLPTYHQHAYQFPLLARPVQPN